VPEFALPVPAPFGLCERPLSLAVLLGPLSPHPKIPFLADKARSKYAAFAAQELNPGGADNVGAFGTCAIVPDSTQALRTADSIPPAHRAAARC
jgi:hypothetical protein